MAKWINIGAKDQFPLGSKTCVMADDEQVLVCHVDGHLAAVSNLCPHARGPLVDGELCGRILTCIYHNHAYDIITGKHIDYPDDYAPVQIYPLRITDTDDVEVDMTEPC